MREKVPEELDWKYRSTRDSEFASARFKCFEILVQDCDGDASRWDIKRGKMYIAMGECIGNDPYHMDAAKKEAREVLVHLWRAVEMNDFVTREWPKLREQGLA